MTQENNSFKSKQKIKGSNNLAVAITLFAVAGGMVGMAFAAVPLYKIFCQVTGYAGTTQKVEQENDEILDKTIIVRFDANKAKNIPWDFKPVQRKVKIRIGETVLIHYKAVNHADHPVTGTATFNVTPLAAGSYFSKIECFCFTEQTLAAGETADMPVTFYVDPEITRNPGTQGIDEITLSYTFFSKEVPGKTARLADKSGKKVQ